MTDTELELAAARVLRLGAYRSKAEGPIYLVGASGTVWRPLSDWRNTGQCLEWLKSKCGRIEFVDTIEGGVSLAWWAYDPEPGWPMRAKPAKTVPEAIVRAVVAVKGGEQ